MEDPIREHMLPPILLIRRSSLIANYNCSRLYDIGDGKVAKAYRRKPIIRNGYSQSSPLSLARDEYNNRRELFDAGISVPKPLELRTILTPQTFFLYPHIALISEKIPGIFGHDIKDKKTIELMLELEKAEFDKAREKGLEIFDYDIGNPYNLKFDQENERVYLLNHILI